jgi:hypothetical protein
VATDRYYFDFFSLDVEGAEYSVLKSIDWDKSAFGMIFIEANGRDMRREEMITSLLMERGYRFMFLWNRSNWYINVNFHKIYDHLA